MEYRRHLTLKDRLKIFLKAKLSVLDISTSAMFDCFDSLGWLEARNRTIQGSLPEDLDEVLMANGEHYAPSHRLDNLIKGLRRRGLPFNAVSMGIINRYFSSYYTYLTVYSRLKEAT